MKHDKLLLKLRAIILFYLLLTASFSLLSQTSEFDTDVSMTHREDNLVQALELRKEERYLEAIRKLDKILLLTSNDAPILLLKGDLLLQSKEYKDAAKAYESILPLNYESTATRINLSYAYFMDHKPVMALKLAREAWEQNITDPAAIVNNFNALLWNLKTREASSFLDDNISLVSKPQQLVMKARLYTTSGDYKNGLGYYDSLNKAFQSKHYAQEYIEVLMGRNNLKLSRNILSTYKDLFSRKEYESLSTRLESSQQRSLANQFVLFSDGAQNRRIENSIRWQQKNGVKYRLGFNGGFSVLTSVQNEKTRSEYIGISIEEKWSMAWSGKTDISAHHISFGRERAFNSIIGKQTIQYQPNDRRRIGLFFNSSILNYTASLLDKNIRSKGFGYLIHFMFDARNGFYSEGSWNTLSDKNNSTKFFGSVYHLFTTEPMLKVGVNLSSLHFSDDSIESYFSPDRYLATEAFIDYSRTLPKLSNSFIIFQAAIGFQKIDQGDWEPSFRLQSEVGFRLKHFDMSIKHQNSNVASSIGTGYRFNSFAAKLALKW